MFDKVIKRTKGKLKVDIGIKDFYQEYCRESKSKNKKTQEYKKYSAILGDFNKILSTKIVTNCESYKMPYKLGLLGVIKFHQNFDIEKKHKWAVDWKKSKELKQIVYFENSERYKWRWDKSYTRFKGKKYYAFIASRQNKRLVKQVKKQNPKIDFYSKLAP